MIYAPSRRRPDCSVKDFRLRKNWRTKGVKNMEEKKHQELDIHIEELEPKVAPSIPPGQHGYEGQPGNQGAHHPGEVTIH